MANSSNVRIFNHLPSTDPNVIRQFFQKKVKIQNGRDKDSLNQKGDSLATKLRRVELREVEVQLEV